jgi:hypothetical protein
LETARLHTAIRTALFFALSHCIIYADINIPTIAKNFFLTRTVSSIVSEATSDAG